MVCLGGGRCWLVGCGLFFLVGWFDLDKEIYFLVLLLHNSSSFSLNAFKCPANIGSPFCVNMPHCC